MRSTTLVIHILFSRSILIDRSNLFKNSRKHSLKVSPLVIDKIKKLTMHLMIILKANDVGGCLLTLISYLLYALINLIDNNLINNAQLFIHVSLNRLPTLLCLLHKLLEINNVPIKNGKHKILKKRRN